MSVLNVKQRQIYEEDPSDHNCAKFLKFIPSIGINSLFYFEKFAKDAFESVSEINSQCQSLNLKPKFFITPRKEQVSNSQIFGYSIETKEPLVLKLLLPIQRSMVGKRTVTRKEIVHDKVFKYIKPVWDVYQENFQLALAKAVKDVLIYLEKDPEYKLEQQDQFPGDLLDEEEQEVAQNCDRQKPCENGLVIANEAKKL